MAMIGLVLRPATMSTKIGGPGNTCGILPLGKPRELQERINGPKSNRIAESRSIMDATQVTEPVDFRAEIRQLHHESTDWAVMGQDG